MYIIKEWKLVFWIFWSGKQSQGIDKIFSLIVGNEEIELGTPDTVI